MLVDRGSLLRKVSDRQLTSENINFNSISNMIYGISSMIYGIGASIDISVRSVLRESRPGFPARGHDSESKRSATPYILAGLVFEIKKVPTWSFLPVAWFLSAL